MLVASTIRMAPAISVSTMREAALAGQGALRPAQADARKVDAAV